VRQPHASGPAFDQGEVGRRAARICTRHHALSAGREGQPRRIATRVAGTGEIAPSPILGAISRQDFCFDGPVSPPKTSGLICEPATPAELLSYKIVIGCCRHHDHQKRRGR
jgi:hypothetical protein